MKSSLHLSTKLMFLLILSLVLSAYSVTAQPLPTSEVGQTVPPQPSVMPETAAADATPASPAELATAASSMQHEEMQDQVVALVMSTTDLRATLYQLLGEHVLLAASATEEALRARSADFEAAAIALDLNSEEIAAAIGLVYGAEAGEAFLPLWRTHIGFFVDYTNAVAVGDEEARQQALDDLDEYAVDFAAFLNSANPNINPDVIVANLSMHVETLTRVIDAQATVTPQQTGDQQEAFMALHEAYAHMDSTAAYLAGAIHTQFPDQFPGQADSAAAGLRSTLTGLLGEHAYLLSRAAKATVTANGIEFEAAAGLLEENSQQIAAAIGSIYGEEAGEAFLPLWRTHIGFFLNYALATMAGDTAGQATERARLEEYTVDFAAFLNAANPDLPLDAVADLIASHAETTLAVIDATMTEPGDFYISLREAYGHMSMIADPLADAIVAQFPEMFGDESMGAAGEPMAMEGAMEGATEAAGDETEASSDTVMVDIQTFIFNPDPLEIPIGATVIWINRDGVQHTATAGTPENPSGYFDSGFLNQGESFRFTFDEAGVFEYFCQRHPSMRGQIIVS